MIHEKFKKAHNDNQNHHPSAERGGRGGRGGRGSRGGRGGYGHRGDVEENEGPEEQKM